MELYLFLLLLWRNKNKARMSLNHVSSFLLIGPLIIDMDYTLLADFSFLHFFQTFLEENVPPFFPLHDCFF